MNQSQSNVLLNDAQAQSIADELTTLESHFATTMHRSLTLLRRFDAGSGWVGDGITSCVQWMDVRLGISRSTAAERLRVAQALGGLPAIDAALAAGELSYSRVRGITRVATTRDEQTWLRIALSSTASQIERLVRQVRRRAEDVLAAESKRSVTWHEDDDGMLHVRMRLTGEAGAVFLKAMQACEDALRETAADDGTTDAGDIQTRRAAAVAEMAARSLSAEASTSTAERYLVHVHVDAEALAGGAGCATIDDSGTSPDTVRRLACEAPAVAIYEDANGQPLSVGRKTRRIPTALRRALMRRDGCCRFPGCTHKRFVDVHHLQHWADGGETSLENTALLCSLHHLALHEGGCTIEKSVSGELVFLNASGDVIQAGGPLSRPSEFVIERLRQDLSAHRHTTLATWHGDPMDLNAAVEAIAYAVPLEGDGEGDWSHQFAERHNAPAEDRAA